MKQSTSHAIPEQIRTTETGLSLTPSCGRFGKLRKNIWYQPNGLSSHNPFLATTNHLRGAHIEAEAKLITRRMITSSIMKDVILNSEPDYRALSLYPIAESLVTPLVNPSGNSVATAIVRTSLAPGLTALRRQADSPLDPSRRQRVCDFIDDYRSSTIFDVLGSVGGLFALLQALHVLIFGQPLFRGLIGAKLISPFGLFGQWSSQGFKQRLSDEYHDPSPADLTQTFRIVKFLQDFVIDFGPVDPNTDSQRLSLGQRADSGKLRVRKKTE